MRKYLLPILMMSLLYWSCEDNENSLPYLNLKSISYDNLEIDDIISSDEWVYTDSVAIDPYYYYYDATWIENGDTTFWVYTDSMYIVDTLFEMTNYSFTTEMISDSNVTQCVWIHYYKDDGYFNYSLRGDDNNEYTNELIGAENISYEEK